MKKITYIPLVIAVLFGAIVLSGSNGITDKTPSPFFKYVGVNSCANTCHKGDSKGRQLEIWQDSKHSKAYLNLQSAEADQIAKDKGFSTPAAETPLCIKCHVLGKDIDLAELNDTFDKTQGVQCETCHGPGSEFKKMSIMKDKQQAIANGLILHDNGAEFCKTCHNSDSPTFKSFDFDEYWEKIKHTDPNLTR
jgi:excinuclease UvrABC ATPase subunit